MSGFVRIASINLCNFKNVENGTVNMPMDGGCDSASVLGVYGQNGSGKTALVDALRLLKLALMGSQISPKYADFIQVGASFTKIQYEFVVKDSLDSNETYRVFYSFELHRDDTNVESNIQLELDMSDQPQKCQIKAELIEYSFADITSDSFNKKKQKLIDTKVDGKKAFSPESKYKSLVKRSITSELQVEKKVALRESRSFIFSPLLTNSLCDDVARDSTEPVIRDAYIILSNLLYYGNYNLHVFTSPHSGLVGLNSLPMPIENKKILISLESGGLIPVKYFATVCETIENMNIVLRELIPNLSIKIEKLGKRLAKNGTELLEIELFSEKNDELIPLRYESDGIKKMIAVMHLLITMFNTPSATVVIDELDAGVFEYLLGELLKIISTHGDGQLIFTSHNLRALETLDKKFVAFTTTNPKKRYIRFVNVKANNNLRDFYYRDIELNTQEEAVYDYTSNAEIAFALREAGGMFCE